MSLSHTPFCVPKSSEHSVKSAGSRSGKRTRPLGSSTAPSGGGTVTSRRGRGRGSRQLGLDASVTSVLTEDSAFPTTTLGRFHDASSSSGVSGPPLPRKGGGEREAAEVGQSVTSQRKHPRLHRQEIFSSIDSVSRVVCFNKGSMCVGCVCVSNHKNKEYRGTVFNQMFFCPTADERVPRQAGRWGICGHGWRAIADATPSFDFFSRYMRQVRHRL